MDTGSPSLGQGEGRMRIWECKTILSRPMTGLRACLGSQEAGASLQLELSTRTLGGWIGEFRAIAAPAFQRSVFTPKISIHGRMSTTEPHGGSRNQGRCVQLLRALQPASQSIVSCVQANPHFYTELTRAGVVGMHFILNRGPTDPRGCLEPE